MKLLLKNIKSYNKEEKQEGDNYLTLNNVVRTLNSYFLYKYIYLLFGFLSFLIRFIPTPDTARRSFHLPQ